MYRGRHSQDIFFRLSGEPSNPFQRQSWHLPSVVPFAFAGESAMALYTPLSTTPTSRRAPCPLPTRLPIWSPPSPRLPPCRVSHRPTHALPESLPPIAHLDRQLSTMHPSAYPSRLMSRSHLTLPVTPPQSRDASKWSRSAPRPADPPSPNMLDDDVSEQPFHQMPVSPRDPSHFIDWFDTPFKRPASFMAEKTCEMICYLWFPSSVPSSVRSRSQIPSPPYSHEASSS